MSDVLKSLLDFVEEHAIQTVSFDVFDTLVFRRLSQPVDVFSEAFSRCPLAVKMAMDSQEYQELRINAEIRVKRSLKNSEATLEEIHARLPFGPAMQRQLRESELQVEQQVSFVYQPMVEFISELITRGVTVLLVSDMYLSGKQIKQCFFSAHPILADIPLYVSSESRFNKASGSMFEHLARTLKIDKSCWLHVGDNRHSDYEMPKQHNIAAHWLAPALEFNRIFRIENTLFAQPQPFNSARMISATHFTHAEPEAFNIGALVWGPILYAFADWIIDQARRVDCRDIICLMREAEVFVPIISLRLKQRKLADMRVKKLYASRKSTFWAAIDTAQPGWFDDLIYVLVQRRGYTVRDFYRDFLIAPDDLHAKYAELKVRDADGEFFEGQNLLKLLTQVARNSTGKLKAFIEQQKDQFKRYYDHHIAVPLAQACLVDLGGGGTIQHQIEQIVSGNSALNLLFYSSERIYRFAEQTVYSSFLNAGTDTRNLRQLVARSPECIEPFLVGHSGTTLGYQDDAVGTPVLAPELKQNAAPFDGFLAGVMRYFKLHHQLNLGSIGTQHIIPILYRYVQFPTRTEAALFTRILHQDNFGSNDAYPIITQQQCDEVSQRGLEGFYHDFCRTPRTKLGKIHWPQAAITLNDENFLAKQQGLMSMDTEQDVLELLERLQERGWKRVSIYGAGLFFEKLLPHLQRQNIQIDHVIDRKAEISGRYEVLGFSVISLAQAIECGVDNIVISSFAFKNEIARNIYDLSLEQGGKAIDILSL